jgi:hypothetical protein
MTAGRIKFVCDGWSISFSQAILGASVIESVRVEYKVSKKVHCWRPPNIRRANLMLDLEWNLFL